MDPKQPDSQETGQLFALAQAGMEMVMPLVAGAFVDYWLRTGPWFTVGGLIFGFVGGTVHLIIMAQRIDRDRERKKKQGP